MGTTPPGWRAAQATLATAEEAEAEFYDALREADLDRLMAMWADDEEIACVHPGGPRVVGTVAVRAGFEAVLVNGPVHIEIADVRRLDTGDCAVHHVTEQVQMMGKRGLQTAYVMVTNVYVRQEDGWRMVCHHASAGMAQDLPDISEPPATLH